MDTGTPIGASSLAHFKPASSRRHSVTTKLKCAPWCTARCSNDETTREYPCTSTVEFWVINLEPTSAIATRALVAVSANWFPLSINRAFVTVKSSFSTAEVRVVYLHIWSRVPCARKQGCLLNRFTARNMAATERQIVITECIQLHKQAQSIEGYNHDAQ